MDRRKFVVSALAAAAIPTAARAEVVCGPPNYQGIQPCEAGIPSFQLIRAMQECPQWCWAACIQMIFAKHGYEVPQRQIVQRVYPNQACAPANGPQMVSAINAAPWVDRYGEEFYPFAYPLADFTMGVGNVYAAAQAAQELSEGRPLINGAVGHATVLTSMSYYRDGFGNGSVQQLIVRDPWPGNPGRRLLGPQEVVGTQLLIAIQL